MGSTCDLFEGKHVYCMESGKYRVVTIVTTC